MDKHCAAVKDWRGGAPSEEEWCLHLCFRGSDQRGGKYHHRPLPLLHHNLHHHPPPPLTLQAFWASSLYSSTASLSAPLSTWESPPQSEGGGSTASRAGFYNQGWSPTSLMDKPPFFTTGQPRQRDAVCIWPPDWSCLVPSSPFSASSRKKSDPCNPVVYCQRPELPPSRWPLRGSIFYIDVTQEHERVTPQSEKNGFRGARFGAPSQTQLVCTTPCWGIIASVRSFDWARCSLSALFWISDSRETIYWCWWKKRPWSLWIRLL